MIIVITGNGKGKTTSAIGQAVRMVGDLKRVLMVQFIKGPWRSGEDDSQMLLRPYFKIVKTGLGFVGILGDTLPREEHARAAREGLALARGEMLSGNWDALILDEVHNAIHLGLLSVVDVLEMMKDMPAGMDMILTGRDAPPALMELGDIVSVIEEHKHPYRDGIEGEKGIEW
jgi:cob(I)alamin adenosyltransferase